MNEYEKKLDKISPIVTKSTVNVICKPLEEYTSDDNYIDPEK